MSEIQTVVSSRAGEHYDVIEHPSGLRIMVFPKEGCHSCTDHFAESLEILLDFVQKPYFTKETIEKEQGIIGQEIKMYEDDPSWRVMFNLLRSMYHVHPVKTDIAGTVESIAEITPEMLYRCYNTFYNLRNMVLCVAGNVNTQEVLEVADRMLKPCEKVEVERAFLPEPEKICQPYIEEQMEVSFPMFQLGFKEEPDQGG